MLQNSSKFCSLSESIDEEHTALKNQLESQPRDCKSRDVIVVKKSFLSLQERKVSLMQEDYQLEQKQNLLEAEIQNLRENQDLLNLKDQQQIKAWEAAMEEFEALK